MSAVKRYIEEYAEQHGLSFDEAQVALAAQQTAREPVSLTPSATVMPPTTQATPQSQC